MIGKTPFQKALIQAVLERNQHYRDSATDTQAAEPCCCLWINWSEGSVSMTEKSGFIKHIFASAEQRDAAIRRLRTNHIIILP